MSVESVLVVIVLASNLSGVITLFAMAAFLYRWKEEISDSRPKESKRLGTVITLTEYGFFINLVALGLALGAVLVHFRPL